MTMVSSTTRTVTKKTNRSVSHMAPAKTTPTATSREVLLSQ
jgi:hypothetical protein